MINKNSNITLVLLPGLNGTEGLFEPLVKAAPSGFKTRVIGFPSQEKRSYQELTNLVLKQLDDIEGDFILVGESFSGPLSLFLAQQINQGLRGVILVASFVSAPNYKVGRFLPWKFGFCLIKPLYALRMFLSSARQKNLIALMSCELQKIAPAVLSDRVQSVFKVDATAALRDCPVPVAYFRGLKDIVVPHKNVRKIISIRSDVKVIEFNTEHFLLQMAPVQAWRAIGEFVASLA